MCPVPRRAGPNRIPPNGGAPRWRRWTASRKSNPEALSRARGLGLSGQMHGATLLDKDANILRPCILWNDVRSMAECAELEAACPDSRAITGNIAMPGFTAPKILVGEEQRACRPMAGSPRCCCPRPMSAICFRAR